MGQLLNVHILLVIVLRGLWNMTKVRETAIIINKVIYRKKKCLGLTSFRDPLMMTTYVYRKMKRKQTKKSCRCLALKAYLAQFTSLVWGFYIPKINYHFNHWFFNAKKIKQSLLFLFKLMTGYVNKAQFANCVAANTYLSLVLLLIF